MSKNILYTSRTKRSKLWLISFQTIVAKELNRFLRIWLQTLLPPAITMSLYFVIFGSVIGNRIGEMSGINYMSYIAPGIIMMAIITNTYGNVVSSFFGAKFQRHIEEILVSPTPNIIILAGYVTGGVCRGILVGLIVTAITLFFTPLKIYSLPISISVVVLTAVLFSLLGFINGIFAKKFDDIAIVPTFVLTPLTYLGGVFYSIDLLPPFWKELSLINPVLYMVNAFRFGFLGVSDIDLMQAYDDYPIICFMQLEDLGFCDKGEAGRFVQSHDLTTGGDFPFNTSGGQLSTGQAGAAGGYIGIVETIRQLTDQTIGNTVENAQHGLVSCFGMINYDRGICTSAAIFSRSTA